MPEVDVLLRWPDGTRQRCYSPSLVVTDHLDAGASYPVPELVARVEAAMGEASERVRARWGAPCSRAAATAAGVRAAAGALAAEHEGGRVVVEGFEP